MYFFSSSFPSPFLLVLLFFSHSLFILPFLRPINLLLLSFSKFSKSLSILADHRLFSPSWSCACLGVEALPSPIFHAELLKAIVEASMSQFGVGCFWRPSSECFFKSIYVYSLCSLCIYHILCISFCILQGIYVFFVYFSW